MKLFGLIGVFATIALATQDYNVIFVNSGSVDYDLASYSIPSGEAWGGVYNEYNYLNIQTSKIGSKKQEQLDYFLEGLGPANIIGCEINSGQFPDGMKLAVKGILSMNVDGVNVRCDDLRIGTSGKWWVGGSNCNGGNKGSDPLTCTCRDGARVLFESKRASNYNKFTVSLVSHCGLIAQRAGSWTPITGLSRQEITWSYSASSSEFTEEEFKLSLSAKYSQAFTFGKLEMSAESSVAFVSQTTTSSSYSHECKATVSEGKRLWQWTYSVTNDCGTSSEFSCYFIELGINDPAPCCLVGYQTNVSDVCTAPGKNMCDGTRRLAQVLV